MKIKILAKDKELVNNSLQVVKKNKVLNGIIHKLKDLGKTVIISSHIFSTLNDTCDEILILENNTISKKVKKTDFHQLENEMKKITIGNKINLLGLK